VESKLREKKEVAFGPGIAMKRASQSSIKKLTLFCDTREIDPLMYDVNSHISPANDEDYLKRRKILG
jgi:hypothetical protein